MEVKHTRTQLASNSWSVYFSRQCLGLRLTVSHCPTLTARRGSQGEAGNLFIFSLLKNSQVSKEPNSANWRVLPSIIDYTQINEASLILQPQQKTIRQKRSPMPGCLPHKFMLRAMRSASSRTLTPLHGSNMSFIATVLSTRMCDLALAIARGSALPCTEIQTQDETTACFQQASCCEPSQLSAAFLQVSGGLVVWSCGLCLFLRMPPTRILRSFVMKWRLTSAAPLHQIGLGQMWSSDVPTHGLFANHALDINILKIPKNIVLWTGVSFMASLLNYHVLSAQYSCQACARCHSYKAEKRRHGPECLRLQLCLVSLHRTPSSMGGCRWVWGTVGIQERSWQVPLGQKGCTWPVQSPLVS